MTKEWIPRSNAFVLAVLLAASCGSTSGGGAGGAGGSAGSGPHRDGGNEASDGSAGLVACWTITSFGVAKGDCNYNASTQPGTACIDGTKTGSCPSDNLYGCCVGRYPIDGYTSAVATCYYSSSAGRAGMTACAGHNHCDAGPGPDCPAYTWQSTPP